MRSIPLHTVEGKLPDDAAAAFRSLETWLDSEEARTLPMHEVEEEQARRGREVLRLMLAEHVRSRGTGDVGPAIDVTYTEGGGGMERAPAPDETPPANIHRLPVHLSHRRPRGIRYVSQFGLIEVTRTGYSVPGQESVMPLDVSLQLPKRSYSYPVQKRLCTGIARGPYLEAVRALAESTGVDVAAANVEDVMRDAVVDFDAFYAQRTPARDTETGPILVSVIDGKGIPMRKLAKKEPRGRRRKKGQKANRKNESRVAAVYTIEPHVRTAAEIVKEVAPSPLKLVSKRPRPESKRVWASILKSKDEVFHEVGQEMLRRDPAREKTWVVVIDGDPALRRRAQRILRRYGALTLILDLFHVLEYLWKAGHAFCGEEGTAAADWVTARLEMLLEGKVSDVARGMRQAATKRRLKGRKLEAVRTSSAYFLNNKRLMQYHEYIRRGLPIGSGAGEGACRNLVKDRLERTGMSWGRDNAEAVLKLRALELCEDTDEYWQFHIQREQARLYANRVWTASE